MRKVFVFIVGLFVVGTVFAVGENVPTSKSYVDSAIALKQDNIPANAGAAQVLTNTGTPGNVGTKNIYDSSAAYAGQTDALVTAGTMNAAVQNAIETEFKCISWVDDDPSKECLLLELRAVTTRSTLPAGYTALEYIKANGQRIMTNIPWNSVARFRGKAQQSLINQVNRAVFGSSKAVSNNYLFSFWGTYYFSSENGKTEWYWNTNILPTTVAEFDIVRDGNTAWYGTVNNVNTSKSNAAFAGNVVLLSTLFEGYGYDYRAFNGNIWYLQLFDANGNILLNGIPARRDSDGVVGMYDLVTNTFLTNAGSGEFIAGPVVNLYMPSGN